MGNENCGCRICKPKNVFRQPQSKCKHGRPANHYCEMCNKASEPQFDAAECNHSIPPNETVQNLVTLDVTSEESYPREAQSPPKGCDCEVAPEGYMIRCDYHHGVWRREKRSRATTNNCESTESWEKVADRQLSVEEKRDKSRAFMLKHKGAYEALANDTKIESLHDGIPDHICDPSEPDGSGVCSICGMTYHGRQPSLPTVTEAAIELVRALKAKCPDLQTFLLNEALGESAIHDLIEAVEREHNV